MSKYRVLLMQPPFTLPNGVLKSSLLPLGLSYLASVLEREKDVEVKIIDCAVEGFKNEIKVTPETFRYGLGFDEIKQQVANFAPDFVGVTVLFSQQARNAYQVCKTVKSVSRKITVAVGGHHPSFMGEAVLNDHPYIDFVVIGEGEYTLREIVRRIMNNKKDFSDIDGLIYRQNDKIILNPKQKWIENLDELPFPARHLCDAEKYFKINLPQSGSAGRIGKIRSLQIFTSRGCVRNCIFCGTVHLWGRRYRYRSPANVIKELKLIKKQYDLDEFQIQDDSFTINKKRTMELLNLMIEQKLDMTWCTPQGIDVMSLDQEIIEMMSRAGCTETTLAIESGDENILKTIVGKPIKLDHVREVIKLLKKNHIRIQAFFIIGFPGETKEQIQKTLNFALSVDLDRISCFIATPLIGTRLYQISKEKNYIIDGFDIENENVNYGKGWIKTEEFTPEYLEAQLRAFSRKEKFRSTLRHPILYGFPYLINSIRNPNALLKILGLKK